MNKTIEIDGSIGEGGGQILRTALSLSCITGHALKLFNIRKARKKPGLMPQHITCVNAAAIISHAQVSGNEKGSTELTFIPGNICAGHYMFAIGTAGSCSLVFQTLLPPLIFSDGPSNITITGGTHVPFSPTYDYISDVFLPMLNRTGIKAASSIARYGFYPKGGGEVSFRIHPVTTIRGMDLTLRGPLLSVHGQSGVSNLPLSIAERQKMSVIKNIYPAEAEMQVMEVPSYGQGTFVFLKGEYEHALAGFSSLGERGKPAEEVGKEAAEKLIAFHNSSACLDPHLADQIVLYLSLAKEASSFTTSRITQHLITNLCVINKFLGIRYEIEGKLNEEGRVILLKYQ
ncbi:MAG: RNA 3'-terminal phosphate cyclase [Nitrospirae bacterium]|nr:RNA 3'-terminal phosphate cyclase [Nitrospirota bacterium]